MGEKLTPPEIAALIQNGQLTPSNYLDLLDPDEAKTFEKLSASQTGPSVPFKEGSRPAGPPSKAGAVEALGSIGAGLLPFGKIAQTAKNVVPAATGAIGGGIGLGLLNMI